MRMRYLPPVKSYLTYLIVFLITCYFPFYSLAQVREFDKSKFIKIANLEGLKVKCMLRDRFGFMWFGTETGLYRYDGYNTELINTTSPSIRLSSNLVLALYEDRQDNLWIGTGNGIEQLSADRKTIKTYLAASKGITKGRKAIYAIAEMDDGSLWCNSDHGSIYRSADKKSFSLIPGTSVTNSKGGTQLISYITQDDNRNIWVADNVYGFRKLNQAGKVVDTLSTAGNEPDFACYANGSVLLYSSKQKIYAYSPEKNRFVSLANDKLSGLINNPILYLYKDKKGYVWIVSKGKLLRLDPRSSQVDDFTREFISSSANLFQIACMYEDAGQQLWFGSYFGAYRLNNRINIFNSVSLPEDPNVNPYFSTRGIVESGTNNLFIGSYSGFYEFNKSLYKFQEFRIKRDNKWKNPLVRAIVPDANNNLWLATEGNGLLYFDTKQHTFTDYPDKITAGGKTPDILSTHNYSLFKDAEGTLWLGGYNNLYTLNPKEGEVRLYTWGAEKRSLPPLKIMAICQSKDPSIWLGTDDGLYLIKKEKGVVAHYTSSSSKQGLTNDFIHCIYEDDKGRLWLGTNGGGINVINPANGNVQETYTVQDGLADDRVCAILPGKKNELWISTYNGLSRLNLQTKSFQNFYKGDGLLSNEFNQGSALAGNDGNLYFGSMDGIIFFDPKEHLPAIKEPQVMLTKLMQHDGKNNKIEETALAASSIKKISLSYKDRFFTVYFTLKDYFENTNANCQFAYRLNGITDQWQNIGAVNYIQFAGLPTGDYLLRIKGMSSDGIWGKKELQIPVSVSAAFYATTGAYIFYALATLLAIAMIYRFQVSRIRLENKLQLEYLQKEKLHELDEMKSRFFTNITHEFRTPLTLIISPLEQLMEQPLLPKPEILQQQHNIIYRNAQRLLRLINQLLDTAKLEAGSMTSAMSQGNVVLFISHLIESFRLQADKKNVRLQFNPGENNHVEYLFDAEKLEKIIYNLLSNALKFTSADGTVTVELTWKADDEEKTWLYLKVTDTGIGIPALQLPFVFDRFYQVDDPRTRAIDGSGVGLFLVKELTELLGGQVTVQSREDKGTTFTVTLPLQTADPLIPEVQQTVLPPTSAIEPDTIATEEPSLSNGPLVLVVEDNDELRDFIASGLAPKYRVLTAQNGKQGWQLAQQELPDLVIADVTMPEMDGFTLSGLIKNTPLTTHIAVILLTARASSENRLQGLSTGANDYLTKPFHLEELHLRIANLLHYQHKLRLYWQQQFKQPDVQQLPAPATEPSVEDPFLLQVNEVLERELSNADFSVDELARQMNVSTRTLHRKISSLTGMNTSELIRSYRLKKAGIFLKQGLTVSEAADKTGFESLSYFSKCFKSQFSVSPSEYLLS